MLMQDAENTDPNRPPTSPALRLHAFDLDQHTWSVVHTAGSINIQKLEALQCHAHKLIAIGWSTLATNSKADSNMQVGCSNGCLGTVPVRRTPYKHTHQAPAKHIAGCVFKPATGMNCSTTACCQPSACKDLSLWPEHRTQGTHRADCHCCCLLALQVCWLDLSNITSCRTPSFKLHSTRSKPTPSWQQLQPQGMVPSARTSVATSVLGNQLLLHGGMLCSKSVAGRLAADTFCLDFGTWTWTRLAAAQEKAVGSSSINTARASHRAVAVPSAAAVMLIGKLFADVNMDMDRLVHGGFMFAQRHDASIHAYSRGAYAHILML